MQLADRTFLVLANQAKLSTNTQRISGWPPQVNAQAGFGAQVVIEPGCVAILTDGNVNAPVLVIVADRTAALLAINFDSTVLNGGEIAPAIASKEQSTT